MFFLVKDNSIDFIKIWRIMRIVLPIFAVFIGYYNIMLKKRNRVLNAISTIDVMLKKRNDLNFIIPTKRIHRFLECIPSDWGKGYDNVAIAVSCENQLYADKRLPFFLELPIKHKIVFVSPILEEVRLEKYLATKKIEKVCVAGESYDNARLCDFDWILNLHEQCKKYNTAFEFYQTGSNFKKDGKIFKISHFKEFAQAKKANLDFEPKKAN